MSQQGSTAERLSEGRARFYEEEGTALVDGSRTGRFRGTILVNRALVEPSDALSLYCFAYGAGHYVATHYHDVDQIQFITDGEMWLGKRRLRAGQGIFTPAGNAYNFTAGPAGVRMLEYRRQAEWRFAVRPSRPEDEAYQGLPEEIPGWEPPPASHKTQFFDLALTPQQPLGTVPRTTKEGAVRLTYQPLVPLGGSDSLSLIAVCVGTHGIVPTHRQDVDKCVHVLGGLLAGPYQRELRRGDGFRWPANTPLCLSAGPAGASFLVFRAAEAWGTRWEDEPPDVQQDAVESSLGGLPF